MPPDPLQGVQKIFLAPARLEKFFGLQPPGFAFNRVGRSEYKGLLKFWLKYCVIQSIDHMHYLPPPPPPRSGQFHVFVTYVIKVDKRKVLRLYFEHIYVLLLFFVFPGKLPLCHKIFDPLDQTKLIKEKYLYSKYIRGLLLLSLFPGKLPLCGKSE